MVVAVVAVVVSENLAQALTKLDAHTQPSHRRIDDVKVTILDVRDNQARVGITAPKDIAVHREEIFYRIKAQGFTADNR